MVTWAKCLRPVLPLGAKVPVFPGSGRAGRDGWMDGWDGGESSWSCEVLVRRSGAMRSGRHVDAPKSKRHGTAWRNVSSLARLPSGCLAFALHCPALPCPALPCLAVALALGPVLVFSCRPRTPAQAHAAHPPPLLNDNDTL